MMILIFHNDHFGGYDLFMFRHSHLSDCQCIYTSQNWRWFLSLVRHVFHFFLCLRLFIIHRHFLDWILWNRRCYILAGYAPDQHAEKGSDPSYFTIPIGGFKHQSITIGIGCWCWLSRSPTIQQYNSYIWKFGAWLSAIKSWTCQAQSGHVSTIPQNRVPSRPSTAKRQKSQRLGSGCSKDGPIDGGFLKWAYPQSSSHSPTEKPRFVDER